VLRLSRDEMLLESMLNPITDFSCGDNVLIKWRVSVR
jgi:hypothetical protein